MKLKILLLTTIFSLSAWVSQAQAPLKVGRNQLNAGVGFSGWGIPLYVGFDHGFRKDVTLGGELSFRSYSNNYAEKSYRHSIIGIAGNANYHFNSLLDIPSEWDLYGGLNVGFYFWSSDSGYKGSGSSGVGAGLQVGGRYFFSNNFGLNLELGGSTAASGGRFGITYIL